MLSNEKDISHKFNFFYSNFLFAQIISPDKVPSVLPVIREANVMFSYRIWRRLPFSHKLNMPIFLPKKNITSNKSLFEIILTGLLSGKLQLYSSSADDFSIPITKEEAIKRLNYIKLSRILDVNSDSNDPIYLDKIDSLVYLPQDVLYYIIKEDWIIDNKNSIADQRIIGVCPVVKFYSFDGIERGLKELFWLYYPNSRYYFNNFLIDKIDSDTSRKTIDDFFYEKSFFQFYY